MRLSAFELVSQFCVHTRLVVLTIKILVNRHDVRKRPSTFRKVQHFALDFGERDVLLLRLLDNLGNEELFTSRPLSNAFMWRILLPFNWTVLHG